MPKFAKKSLSFLLRNDCPRQFRLSLYNDVERKSLPIPSRQQARAGSGNVGAAGDEYQAEQISNIERIFGSGQVVSTPPQPGKTRPEPTPIDTALSKLHPFQFLIEGRFELPKNFRAHFGLNGLEDEWRKPLTFAELQPDIILALPSRKDDPEAFPTAISLDGSTVPISATDDRTQLRVIDIKMSSEPGAHYFAEVVYYAMALAAWLKEHNLDHTFVVTSNPAVWPGSYAKSALAELDERSKRGVTATPRELVTAMDQDLETAEVGVYVPPLRRFFSQRLKELLTTPWQDLEWHPNFRCQNCEFLGYPWPTKSGVPINHPEHCWPKAEKGDRLSRIAGLSRGAAKALLPVAPTVQSLQLLPSTHPIFKEHPMLRAKGSIFHARASSLKQGTASTIAASGANATIPTFCDLKVCIFLDYDAATSITAAISLLADWREPTYEVPDGEVRLKQRWGTGAKLTFINGSNTVGAEEKQVLAFLNALKAIFSEVRTYDAQRSTRNHDIALKADTQIEKENLVSTYQIFLWDEAQFRHLRRIISRHFGAIIADPDLRSLAWLFPPDDVLPHPDYASRQSPISLLNPAIEHHVAAPVPHHYTLLRVAETYLPSSSNRPLSVHPLYYEPLTNLIPGERTHEFWNQDGDWMTTGATIRETNYKKTIALSFILGRLIRDAQAGIIKLGESAAPKLVQKLTPRAFKNPTDESQLWFEFTRLNAELQKVEAELTYALPPTEREAKFESALLNERLTAPDDIAAAIDEIERSCHVRLPPNLTRLIYRLSPDSREVKFKDGDFTLAISPRSEDLFLHKGIKKRLPAYNAHYKVQSSNTKGYDASGAIGQKGLTRVTLEAIDRQNGWVSLLPDRDNKVLLLEQLGDADFTKDVMLDKLGVEFLETKVRLSLEGLGLPKSYATQVPALTSLLAPTRALATPHPVQRTSPTGRASGKDKPGHDFLYWPHLTINQSIARPVAALRATVVGYGLRLNDSQSRAFDAALSQRLSLIWGPPGTGKSATLTAILIGAIEHARATDASLRILITANTYTAVDNVLLAVEKRLRGLGLSLPTDAAPQTGQVRLFRVQSTSKEVDPNLAKNHPHLENISLETATPSPSALSLRQSLTTPIPGEIILVGTPNQQAHNLALASTGGSYGETQKPWFDLIIIDEASQMDTPSSALVFTKAAPDATCILAGDHLQLPPIHTAEPPKGMENYVGPVFSFFVEHHKLPKLALEDNYRSNQGIVSFVREAGYDPALKAHFSDLELNLTTDIPRTVPSDWPAHLPFSPHYADILAPARSLLCFVSDDISSGQSNAFEAQTISALCWLLWKRLAPKYSPLHHEARDTNTYNAAKFWEEGVGIVAPHRAQCSLIADDLNKAFLGKTPTGATPQIIRAAVDTVERYQGQERDAIFASFGLGDPDLIALEDEFLYNLNRFNVLVSRAATKAMVLLSRNVVEHLSDDQDVIRSSRLLKNFVGLTCTNSLEIELPYFDASGALRQQKGELRWA